MSECEECLDNCRYRYECNKKSNKNKKEYSMGNLKTFLIFGYERWGGLRPAYCCSKDAWFKPLFWGI